MMALTMAEAARLTAGRLRGEGKLPLPPVSTDTRTLQAGQCFLALTGPRYDGHHFIGQALEKGAAAVIHSGQLPQDLPERPVALLQVPDTLAALQLLAHFVRQSWKGPLLAITGSMGKTTTRRFCASLLGPRFQLLEPRGNRNNHIGLPLTLLELEERHELALLELGMNHSGEIRTLARLCQPTAALVTNVAPVHLEQLRSLEAIAAAKGEILEYLDPSGTLYFNADDARVAALAERFPGPRLSFGFAPRAGVRVLEHRFQGLEQMDVALGVEGETVRATLPFAGRHLLYNVAAAVAVAFSFGLSRGELEEVLPALAPPPMRGEIVRLAEDGDPLVVLNEAYNSNPRALASVLELVGALKVRGRTILALGAMLELGEKSPELHREAGRQAARSGADLLVTVGEEARFLAEGARQAGFPEACVRQFEDASMAGRFLAAETGPGDFLLIKGSRGVGMEEILHWLGRKERVG